MRTARKTMLGAAVALALAAAAPHAPAAAPRQTARESADDAVARDRAREVIRRENEAVRRRARIARLTQIYEQRGQAERVARLRALQRSDDEAHRAALARLEQDLGPGRYERLRNSMRGQIAARNQAAAQQQRERADAATRDPRGRESRADDRPRADAPSRPTSTAQRPSSGRP